MIDMVGPLSRRVDYALRAVIFLAHQEAEKRMTVDKIANNGAIPKKFLEKILRGLVNQGIVKVYYGW